MFTEYLKFNNYLEHNNHFHLVVIYFKFCSSEKFFCYISNALKNIDILRLENKSGKLWFNFSKIKLVTVGEQQIHNISFKCDHFLTTWH